LFRGRFGEYPPDYIVQSVLHEIGGLRLRSDGIETVLANKMFINQLREAYFNASDMEADPTQLFRWAVLSLIVGKDAALRLPGREWRSDRKEIAIAARHEAMANSPTIDVLVSSLENAQKDDDPEYNIETWAIGLGVSHGCWLCDNTMVDPDEFAEAAIKHFKVRGKRADVMRERLSNAMRSIAIETGSLDNPGVCGYCDHLLSDD
jgi:hypothetical protein